MSFDKAAYQREYMKEYRAGIRRGQPRRRSIAERLLAHTDRTIGSIPDDESLGLCWIWKGALNVDGYGVIRGEGYRAPLLLAHRVALSLALGRPIADGLFANHRCDTPACVRPRHLYEGTAQENVDDMHDRDRAFRPRRAPKVQEGQAYG